MRRVALIGSGGSGKSVLAAELGRRLGLPVIHLDRLFWRPGWVETPLDEWRRAQEELVRADEWIIDGNHATTIDVRLRAADTVVLLDFNRYLCTWRIVKRSLSYRGRTRIDRADGCGERLDRQFVGWVWNFPKRGRPEALEAIERYAQQAEVIRLRNPKEVKQFLQSLPLV